MQEKEKKDDFFEIYFRIIAMVRGKLKNTVELNAME
jgi:hypothetical protein